VGGVSVSQGNLCPAGKRKKILAGLFAFFTGGNFVGLGDGSETWSFRKSDVFCRKLVWIVWSNIRELWDLGEFNIFFGKNGWKDWRIESYTFTLVFFIYPHHNLV